MLISQLDRAYKIADTFIKSIRDLKRRVVVELREGNDYACIEIMGYISSFSLTEIKTKRRSLASNTEQENKSKSFRPAYENIYSGEFILEFKEIQYYGDRNRIPELILKFEDSTDCRLEDKFGEIFISLCRLSNEAKITNIIKEREDELERHEKRRQLEVGAENKRQLELIEEQKRKKQKLLDNIDEDMESWFKAQRLNKYADELEECIATIDEINSSQLLLSYIVLVREKARTRNHILAILSEMK